MDIDLTVYLVTDSTMVPESSTFLKQVEDSVNAGATIVQLREKSLATRDFIRRAEKVHEITKKKGVPLIINDRIDVALAIDAEGVHVGQDDMPATLARKLLGPNKILGVTCSNPQEVREVCEQKVADYVGIGTVYKTNTKTDTKTPLGTGPIGIRKMLQELKYGNAKAQTQIKSVAIGGINETNVAKVLFQCQVEGQKLDGVAVVSCIMAKEDAFQATKELQLQIAATVPWIKGVKSSSSDIDYTETKKIKGALVHHITNNVVKNFSANVTLAIGASPIMSELAEEYEEFCKTIPNLALVLNLGTPTPEMMSTFVHAIQTYNKYGKHIVFDPVAAGATTARLNCCRTLLNAGQVSVIKANVGEISAIWKLTSTYNGGSLDISMRGVDSIAKLSEETIIEIAKEVSKDFKCLVVVTGEVNYVVDRDLSAKVAGGSRIMGLITGSGCSLGSTIGSFLAANTAHEEFDIFKAVLNAVFLYNEAGKKAAEEASTPGAFMAKFLDQLYIAVNR